MIWHILLAFLLGFGAGWLASEKMYEEELLAGDLEDDEDDFDTYF